MSAPVYKKRETAATSLPTTSHGFVYHPQFSSPEADMTLRSFEGTLYRVSSYTLRTTSGLFQTMFCLPQPVKRNRSHCLHSDECAESDEQILDVYEENCVLVRILSLMSGLPTPKWETFEELEKVLITADKWDTPGPISIIRSVLTSPHFLSKHSLRIYALAKHFNWEFEAKLASTHTLSLNLNDPSHSLQLCEMSSKDLLPLLNLHRQRRDRFWELLNSPERFTAGNSSPYHCSRCGVTQLDNHTWRDLKNAMFLEMDRRPLGDTLGLSTGETAEWPEAQACWEAKCTKLGCGGFNYDRIATLRQIKNCLDSLPISIED